jgi:hypothetical protein
LRVWTSDMAILRICSKLSLLSRVTSGPQW